MVPPQVDEGAGDDLIRFEWVRVEVDEALDQMDQDDVDGACSHTSWGDEDDDPTGVPDQAALADFVERLLCGDVAVARVLAARAFAECDLEVVERIFSARGRTFSAPATGAST